VQFPVLQIGRHRLERPVAQAALSGYSDGPMRILARRFGAGYTLGEVMIDRFAKEVGGSGKTSHHLRIAECEHPVGGQLMGSDPEEFPAAAKRLVEAGFDVIDINFGCPVKTAIGGCRGGYHLGQPAVALEIVRRVRDALPAEIPLTLKMRRGIDDTTESADRFFEILDGAFASGVAAITVHGRTVKQGYIGPSRWEFLRRVKQHVGKRTILGSGDLFAAEDGIRMLEATGVDGLSIARGAIGNPWIFRDLAALLDGRKAPPLPTTFEQREVLQEHIALLMEHYPAGGVIGLVRKFSLKYAKLHPHYEAVRNAFATVKSFEEWNAALQRWYAEDLPGQRPETNEIKTVHNLKSQNPNPKPV
jgi:tRNA-dihydrouridine synthase B